MKSTFRFLLIFLIFLLVVGCVQEEPTPVVVEEETVATAETAVDSTSLTQPVQLVAPLPDAQFEGASVNLEWNWIRKLGPNERYDVRVWKEGEPELGITLIQQPRLNLTNWLVYQTPGTYLWRVFVVQMEGDQQVQILSESGEPRKFTVANVSDPAKQLTVPEGFEVALVASVNSPTAVQVLDDGTLYIASMTGEVLVQRPDKRGTSDFEMFGTVQGITTGMYVYEDTVYVSHAGQVTALKDTDGDFMSDEATELFEPDVLPGVQYDSHSNNGLVVGKDGALYIAVGGTSDHGPETHSLGGTILRYDLDTGEYEVFARGTRNPYDIVMDEEGNLYAGDNGADAPDANMLAIPPDEINLIEEGKNYGYPDYFGIPPADSGVEPPLIAIPASSVTTGLHVYNGDQFPAEYQGALFAALWGNAVITHPTGHRVSVVTRAADGSYQQENFVDFATGTQRPIDVTQTETGSILIADFENGNIYEVSYTGE